ncbi:MAG: dihydrolipoyl dehydrogenase [Deltaproteobacteria bacterium]|nr:dihydrolipoyl dehydrogenase [Deltaproteobacteria bacterium]
MVVGNLTESSQTVIIGAGPGGYVAAIRLAQLGQEVTLIDRAPSPGGACLHRGCIPSKALIEVAKHFSSLESLKDIGIEISGKKLHWQQSLTWKKQILDNLSQGIQGLLKNHQIKWIQGEAKFLNPHELNLQTPSGLLNLHFEKAILATGSRPKSLKGWEFKKDRILSSKDLLEIKELPKSLIVLGGGYIGLELGMMMAQLGVEVKIIEALEDILPNLDKDLKRPLKKKLKSLNLEILTKTRALSYQEKPNSLSVQIETEGKKKSISAQKVLVAVGREPNTQGLELEKIGLKTNSQGLLEINENCQTSLPHLYAIGDITPGPMLAHRASRQAKVAAAHLAGKTEIEAQYIPAVIFTHPEIAWVGLNEEEAKEKGLEVESGLFPFAALGRAQTLRETEGIAKIVSEKSTGRLLGVHLVGPQVSELILSATLALEMGAHRDDLSLSVAPHPSLSEALSEATEAIHGLAIHRYQRKKT